MGIKNTFQYICYIKNCTNAIKKSGIKINDHENLTFKQLFHYYKFDI